MAKQPELVESSEHSPYNGMNAFEGKAKLGVIACGIGYNYVMENDPQSLGIPVLKVSQYPLPEASIKALAAQCESLLVAEDGQPLVEEQVKAILGADYALKGRLTGDLPRMGELTPDCVGAALGVNIEQPYTEAQNVMPRPPALCQGCGHRDVYDALNKVAAEYEGARIFGDIGC